MHDQLIAVIVRRTCSMLPLPLVLDLVMAVVCRFLALGVRRTENVVGMAFGLRERLLRYDIPCSAIRCMAALDVACSSKHSAPKCAEQMTLLGEGPAQSFLVFFTARTHDR